MLCNRVSEAVTQTVVSLLASSYPAASTCHAKLLWSSSLREATQLKAERSFVSVKSGLLVVRTARTCNFKRHATSIHRLPALERNVFHEAARGVWTQWAGIPSIIPHVELETKHTSCGFTRHENH